MCGYWSDLSQDEQLMKYTQVVDFLTKIDNRLNSQQKLVATYIKNLFIAKLGGASNDGEDETNVTTTYEIPNVDMEAVNNAWLNRHNEARWWQGIYPYQRDEDLSMTAHNWATYLASINNSTHKRKSTDGYYNYNSIKEWFANQGVYFDESNGTAFTENIAYQYYYCDKDDCSQELINAIRKGFDFFMSEAGRNGPHYRWVMSPYYSKMWMGVAFVGKRYYIVTHYGKR